MRPVGRSLGAGESYLPVTRVLADSVSAAVAGGLVRALVFSRPGEDVLRHEALAGAWGRSPEVLSSLTRRTDALLLRLSLVVGKEVFYAALWGSVLASPAVRLPASLFVVTHISRDAPGKEQKYMLGTDYQLTVGAALLAGAWGLLGHTGAPVVAGLQRDIRLQREMQSECVMMSYLAK